MVEPSKPRTCHNERFLNLWIKDLPLSPDSISDLPRYVFKSHFQTSFDNKSGYDYVKLSPVGLEWKGWYFSYKTPLFGWKASIYILSYCQFGSISALLLSPAINKVTATMSANPLYAEILSGGPIFSLLRLLLLLCVQLWFTLDISLASPNLFLFPKLETGFWVFCGIPSFKLSLFPKKRESSLPPFVTPFSSKNRVYQGTSEIRRQGYLFPFSCPGLSVPEFINSFKILGPAISLKWMSVI